MLTPCARARRAGTVQPRLRALPWLSCAAVGLLLLGCGGESGSSNPGAGAANRAGAAVEATDTREGGELPGVAVPAVDGSGGGASGDGSSRTPVESSAEPSCGCPLAGALQLLRCEDDEGVARPPSGTIEVNSTGDAAMFHQCTSADGLTAPNHCQQFLWTAARGAERLADRGWLLGLADDGTALFASAVDAPENAAPFLIEPDGSRTRVPLSPNARLSADGRYVIDFVPAESELGESGQTPPNADRRDLVRWSLAKGLERLGSMPADTFEGGVYDVSRDGSVIVGGGMGVADGFAHGIPMIWTRAAGLRELGGAPRDERGTGLFRVSSDGSAVMGMVQGNDSSGLFHWTELDGFRSILEGDPLGAVRLPGNPVLSRDGQAFSSTSMVSGMSRAYRWTRDGLAWLGPDGEPSSSVDMTADGSVVLGVVSDLSEGFISAAGETRSFSALLESESLELEDWRPQAPLRISDDGRFVFGFALCGGQMTPYRWQLPR